MVMNTSMPRRCDEMKPCLSFSSYACARTSLIPFCAKAAVNFSSISLCAGQQTWLAESRKSPLVINNTSFAAGLSDPLPSIAIFHLLLEVACVACWLSAKDEYTPRLCIFRRFDTAPTLPASRLRVYQFASANAQPSQRYWNQNDVKIHCDFSSSTKECRIHVRTGHSANSL